MAMADRGAYTSSFLALLTHANTANSMHRCADEGRPPRNPSQKEAPHLEVAKRRMKSVGVLI